jgi:hypothetical protein
MDPLDCLLIAWWLLAAATIIPTMFLARRQHVLHRNAAASAYLRGQIPGRYGYSTGTTALPRPVLVALLVSIALLIVGLLSFIWMHNWTRLLFLNFQLFIFLFGASSLFVGLSRNALVTPQGWLPPIVTRWLYAIFGALMAIAGAYWLIGDLAFPRVVVEGRVEKKNYYLSSRFNTNYDIFINGRKYEAMRTFICRLTWANASMSNLVPHPRPFSAQIGFKPLCHNRDLLQANTPAPDERN